MIVRLFLFSLLATTLVGQGYLQHRRLAFRGGAAASYSDNFNRSESPLSDGGVWATSLGTTSAFNADGTTAVSASSGEHVARVTTPSFNANHKATITLNDTSSVSPAVRVDSNGNCYIAYIQSTTAIQIYEIYNNGDDSVAVGSVYTVSTLSASDTVGLSASGTGATVTLTVYVNDSSEGDRTDSSSPLVSGQPGIHAYSINRNIDAFSAEDL